MNAFAKITAIALFAIASFCAYAQTSPASIETVNTATVSTVDNPELATKKAAAQKWLEMKKFNLLYTRAQARTGFYQEVFPQKKEIVIGPQAGTSCGTGTLPAVVSEENGQVSVLVPRRRLPDCTDLKFVFDPVTLTGQVQVVDRNTGRATTVETTLTASPE